MIRISIYEDNDLLRETLALILSAISDLHLVGQYANAMEVVNTVVHDQPDVILMDINMPGRTGIEAVRLIRQHTQQPKILMLTVFEDVDQIFAALSAGAVGYLLKNTPADKLLEAIREVDGGGAVMTPSIALKVLDAFKPGHGRPVPTGPTRQFNHLSTSSSVTSTSSLSPETELDLTHKEREVLERLVEGDSYKLIAHHCGISLGTVRWHMVHIYQKLHVNSKSEAVIKVLRKSSNQ